MKTEQTCICGPESPAEHWPNCPQSTTTKHSPGPWTAGQNEQNRFIKDATGNCIIAYNRAMFSGEDARLMAAAPDLVAALESILDEAEDREDIEDGANGPLPNIWMRIAQDARAAIAKARGES